MKVHIFRKVSIIHSILSADILVGTFVVLAVLANTHGREAVLLEITLVAAATIAVRAVVQHDFLLRNIPRRDFLDVSGELAGGRILASAALREDADLMVLTQFRAAGPGISYHIIAQNGQDRPFLFQSLVREMTRSVQALFLS